MSYPCSFSGDMAVSVLFGEKTDKALGKAMHMIVCDCNADHHSALIKDELLKICREDTYSVDSVTRIVAGTAIASPQHAHLWLEDVSMRLAGKDRLHFQLGVTLGLFEASQWFDEKWRAKIQFQEKFPSIVTRLILAQTTLTTKNLKDPFRGKLSSSIKAWVHPEYNKGIRLAQVERTVREVCEELNRRKSDDIEFNRLAFLGDFILDQITYAVFGQFAPIARVKAIRYMYDDMFAWFKSRAKQVEEAGATEDSILPAEETR